MSNWRVIDSVPTDGTNVLLWNAETKSVNVGYWQEHYTPPFHAVVLGHDALWNDDDGPQPIFDATHWMPLPAPPEGA